jgi:biopolymer transport protein ExbD
MATRSRRSRAHDESAGIELAPMLDLVFIMIVLFVVTVSFVREVGIELRRPPEPAGEPDARTASILLTVTAANEIWLGDRRIDVESIRSSVGRLHAVNPQAGVVIRAHEDSDTEVFARIADQARQAGVRDVSLTTFRE